MNLFLIGVVCSFISLGTSEDVRLVELEPDQAAQIINQQEQSLKYAPKIESNVPGVRIINDHPENVVEDIYLANQYHGQDGLGAYIYGYSIPDISKTEKKERGGNLKGAYNYIAGNGQEIKVEYWDDGTGFHQVDNVDRIQPQQVEDSPEVKAAKEEHLRIWHEQAERNSHAPADPYAQQYDQPQAQQPIQDQYNQYRGQVSQPKPSQSQNVLQYQSQPQPRPYSQVNNVQQQQQQLSRQFQQPGSDIINSADYTGQYTTNQQTWAQHPGTNSGTSANHPQAAASSSSETRQPFAQTKKDDEENQEENGPPKGFFYKFDYPTGLIVGREGKNLEAYYSQGKNAYEGQLRGEGPRPGGSSSSYHASA